MIETTELSASRLIPWVHQIYGDGGMRRIILGLQSVI